MNVLFLFDDQHRADCLGFTGHPMVKTPNLDALAACGAHFTNMFTCAALCGPSRTSFFTGAYLRTHGHYGNNGDIRRPMPGLAEVLRSAGYYTFQAGKDHLPPSLADGFDEMHTMDNYKQYLAAKGLQRTDLTEEDTKNFMSKVSPLSEEDQDETWTADRAIDFLRSRKSGDKPFFMWVSFDRPHSPHTPPASFDDLYDPDDVPVDWEEYEAFENSRLQNRPMIEDFWKVGAVRHDPKIFQKAVCRYLALITLIDKNIGRIIKALEEAGLKEDTLVVFTSDHGDWGGQYGQLGKNLPAYDSLLKIPFIWYDPKRKGDAGRGINGLCSSVDFMPTLLDRLGIECPPTVQGESVLPLLDGVTLPQREAVFAETPMEKTIRTREWKLTYFVRHPERGQLFKMGPKPDEITNHWDDPAYAHIKQDLLLRLMEWMVRCEQPHCGMPDWEACISTRWYDWLNGQPMGREIPDRPPKNQVKS